MANLHPSVTIVGMGRPSDISPSAILTPRALVARLRELSGENRAPIGERAIRRAIRAGRYVLRGLGIATSSSGAITSTVYGLVPEPVHLPPDRAAQIEADVMATIPRPKAQSARQRSRSEGVALRTQMGRGLMRPEPSVRSD
jgi:hypothetical protein